MVSAGTANEEPGDAGTGEGERDGTRDDATEETRVALLDEAGVDDVLCLSR